MNRKLILLLLIVLSVCAISHASAVEVSDCISSDVSNATVIQEVAETDDSTVGLDEQVPALSLSKTYNVTPENSIQDAIDNANPGDTINLSGEFKLKDSVIINKSVSVIGSGAIIKPDLFIDAPRLFIINSDASNVVLSNLKFYSAYPNGAVLWQGNDGCIKNCEFYKNSVLGDNDGGALILRGNNCNVTNCSFEENHANRNGGAISLEGNNCQIIGCSFDKNYASVNGGAIYVKGDENRISGCEFNDNYVTNPQANTTSGGGAVFSTRTLTIDNSKFNRNKANGSYGGAVYLDYHGIIQNSFFNANNASKGNDIAVNPDSASFIQIKYNEIILDYKETVSQSVSGIDESVLKSEDNHNTFTKTKRDSKVNFISGMIFNYGSSGKVSVIVDGGKIESSNIRVLNHPEAKISFSNNVLTVSGLDVGKYTLRVTTTPDDDHNSVDSDLSVTVNKAPATIKATKSTVAYKKAGKFSVTFADSRTGKGIANMKVTLKVYTGKKYKKLTLTTNSKGVVSYKTKKLSKGSHKVVISATHKGYTFRTVTSSIKVVKQKAIKFKVKKRTLKDGAVLSITILNKKTKKPMNGVKVKLLIYSGSKLTKTEILKSLTREKNKGVVGYATNELSVGKHKVKIVPYAIKYSGSAKSSLKILKSAKKYEQITTRISAKV